MYCSHFVIFGPLENEKNPENCAISKNWKLETEN